MGVSCPKRARVEHSIPFVEKEGKLVSIFTKEFVLLICFKCWQVAQLSVCMTASQKLSCNVVLLSHPFKMYLSTWLLLFGTSQKAGFLPNVSW